MRSIRPAGQAIIAVTVAIGGIIAAVAIGAQAGERTLCNYQVAPVSGGLYTVQNNKFASTANECVATDGGADFTVASSGFTNQWSPGGYPSIFMGCHWGDCTRGGLAKNPLLLGNIGVGNVTTNWSVTTPAGSGNVYDVAYDIWINQTPTTSVKPNGTEVMVWLEKSGPIQPAGSLVASGVWIGGYEYNIWYKAGIGEADVVSYQMTSPVSSVTNLDLGSLLLNAEQSNYTSRSWYLVSVEAGFEIWQGGVGLATTSFAVNLTGPASSRPASSSRAASSHRNRQQER